ncbi:MAG: ComEC/Rec2 family competence protein [Chitinophagaceae bacterium]|nr:ComEC/Rec2 family competence protein [Chitinophagaceae bacterium]
MKFKPAPLWKEAPFIRYLIPFATGITCQWNRPFPIRIILYSILAALALFVVVNGSHLYRRFYWYCMSAASIYVLFFLLACLLVFLGDIRNDKNWIGYKNAKNAVLLVRVRDPPLEKTVSYRVTTNIEGIILNDSVKAASGTITLSIEKDSSLPVRAGNLLCIATKLRPIADFPNSTGFSYRKYCALMNTYHQAYLQNGQYLVLDSETVRGFSRLFSYTREKTLAVLRTYIEGKKEAGLAEALLIGYKNDLDKELVRSYSNTGVVHIIAISGLHVGLIYYVLLVLLKPFSLLRYFNWLRPLVLLSGLWSFSLLAGSSPSVLRSALMFSVIVLGNSINRRSSIYNSLAVSAFLLLCFHPLWLFDAGFQLSYMAVLSLVIFMKPIYNLVCVRNKLLDIIWKLAAVTLSAQVLTIPLCLYYFQQFPNWFLVSNMVAVPLSTLILMGMLVLCVVSFFPILPVFTGRIVTFLIRLMNDFIIHIERMPLTVTGEIGISFYQLIILFLFIALVERWRRKRYAAY